MTPDECVPTREEVDPGFGQHTGRGNATLARRKLSVFVAVR